MAPHRGTKARILVFAILDRDRQTTLGEGLGLFHLCERKGGHDMRDDRERRPIELQKEDQTLLLDSRTRVESPCLWLYLVIYSRMRKMRANRKSKL